MRLNIDEAQGEASAIAVIEDVRRRKREFKHTLLGELMDCSQQKKIARIKIVRTHTGLDLKRAKMVMDTINDEIPFLDLAEFARTQETLQRVGDENSRLRRQCGDTEDLLGGAQEDLRIAEATREDIRIRYVRSQVILEQARALINILSDETAKVPDDLILRGLTMTLAGLIDSATEE